MGRQTTDRTRTDSRTRRRMTLRGLLVRFAGDRRGNVLIMFALTLPALLAIVAGGVDVSYGEDAKVELQDATDAAALAVSAEVVKNPNETESTLQQLAQASLNANYTMKGATTTPTITNFHVCAPVQNDCNNQGNAMANDTVAMNTTATAPCIPIPIPTVYCTGSPAIQTVNANTTAVLGFGATLQLNIVMDTSASMIVGATTNDVNLIAGWMSATTTRNEICDGSGHRKTCVHWGNWNSMMSSGNQIADYPQGGTAHFPNDNPPCAFACHDGGSGTRADVMDGLTNAHAAGATTRFDVMIAAANQLVSNIQSLLASNSNLAKNTYLVNIYGFDRAIAQYGTTNMPCTATVCSGVTNAISAVNPGFDTYLNSAMSSFSAGSGTYAIGPNGNGSSSSSPLKFMILVTDGLQSDRGNNWSSSYCPSGYSGPSTGFDTAWSYSNQSGFTTHYCGFDTTIDQSTCTALKNEGVVLAVLETPYVPLDGQDPQVQPYEQTVRHTIYPNGANTASTVSAALQTCATTGYYFQANSPSDISTGFTNLTTKFIQQHSYLSK